MLYLQNQLLLNKVLIIRVQTLIKHKNNKAHLQLDIRVPQHKIMAKVIKNQFKQSLNLHNHLVQTLVIRTLNPIPKNMIIIFMIKKNN